MKPRRFHGLKRPKLRQTWNKYNLYNMIRMRAPNIGTGVDSSTFFQQKWRAKGMLRAYHGEHIVERKWERMFSRRLLSVTEMDPKYMAEYDGAELAAGRGSGKDERRPWAQGLITPPARTPYMQMTFAPMERRLDIAIFRAMFASSARQARQFCVHGAVKVNGKKMPYPAYRLNPGDMFQVDPDMVMYATGQKKRAKQAILEKQPRKKKTSNANAATEAEAQAEPSTETEPAASVEPEAKPATAEQDPDTTDAPEPLPVDLKPTRERIRLLSQKAKALAKEEESASQKKKLRAFIQEAKRLLGLASRPNASPTEIADQLATVTSELSLGKSNEISSNEPAPQAATTGTKGDAIGSLNKYELKLLEQRMKDYMREQEENPIDRTKPYATPWRPRYYMSPFAFIPKYLEVNQNICSAVYLRHPVARRGWAEVPTPFGNNVSQLAFNWYLRRR
ncbi:hypothetical protein F4778DRAFT_764984 [Xylariomycetidae sp. FL2044]|nr:hypothetical protein F4778DRAFT_764984 [Xylariomycetidae sp. FL2044]